MRNRPIIPQYHFSMHYGFAAFLIAAGLGIAAWLLISMHHVSYELGYWDRDRELRTVRGDVTISGAGADAPVRKGGKK